MEKVIGLIILGVLNFLAAAGHNTGKITKVLLTIDGAFFCIQGFMMFNAIEATHVAMLMSAYHRVFWPG